MNNKRNKLIHTTKDIGVVVCVCAVCFLTELV